MKFAPEKTIEIKIPQPLARVREVLIGSAAEKRQKNVNDPDYRKLFGKVTETGFKLSPNTGYRNGYSPVMTGELTEVTESKPTPGDEAPVTRTFTRVNANMKVRPSMRFFSILWAVICAVLLGLALWLCFKKGFENRWYTLLIGPVLFLIERIACGIGFRSSSRKLEKLIKGLFN